VQVDTNIKVQNVKGNVTFLAKKLKHIPLCHKKIVIEQKMKKYLTTQLRFNLAHKIDSLIMK
jgi:hypothetical protein